MEWLAELDRAVVEFMATTFRNGFCDAVMPVVSLSGDVGVVWLGVTAALLCFKKTRLVGVICGCALLLHVIGCNLILKTVIGRARPDLSYWNPALLIAPTDSSFPSGHTSGSFAVGVSLFFYKWQWGLAGVGAAALVGFSRMYLCVHYLTDVAAGALLGTACALSAGMLVKYIAFRRKRLPGI